MLSHSVQQEEEEESKNTDALNQRASSGGLGHVTEAEEGRSNIVISPLNKDGSSYNIATSDITAIPSKVKKPEAKKNTATVPSLDMANVEKSTIMSPKTEKSLKKQKSK